MSENQKKIWITGASSGIGKALAEKFALEGWKVAISARRKEILEKMTSNENIFSYPLDVTNQDQINSVLKNIISDFGNLDLCVFSSGTYDPKLEQEINVKQNNKNQLPNNYIGPEEYKNGYGRELFKNNRAQVTNSENGAISIG